MTVCLTYAPEDNTLCLTVGDPPYASSSQIDGVIDVGTGGRLVGIELRGELGGLRRWLADPVAGAMTSVASDGSTYLALTRSTDNNVRSVPIRLRVERDVYDELIAIAIPRRGAGYEISYPSGNQ